MDILISALLAVALGVGGGLLLGRLLARSSFAAEHVRLRTALEHERAIGAERLGAARNERARAEESFRALSADALRRNSTEFLQLAEERLRAAGAMATGELEQRRQAVEYLVTPLRETLGKVETQLESAELRRSESSAALARELELVRAASEQVRRETATLVTALRKPQTRGRWGEMQLRRVVELAGMVDRCDFDTQVTVGTADGPLRPDMVVRLAGSRSVVVDAKVSLAAFLEAAEASTDDVRTERFAAHARQLRAHVDALAGKAYWSAFSACPEFVVLFVPGEAFLAPALDADPHLLEDAFAKRVHIMTPTTLISSLRTIAFEWQQSALTDNAREIYEVGRELYKRLATFGGHVERLGRALGGAVGHYNASVGSLERSVLSQARRLQELEVTDAELPAPVPLDEPLRAVSAGEFLNATATNWQVIAPLPVPPPDDPGIRRATDLGDPADLSDRGDRGDRGEEVLCPFPERHQESSATPG